MKIVYLYANLTHNDQMFLQDSQASVMFQKPCVLPKLLFITYTCMTSRKVGGSEIKVAVFFSRQPTLNENIVGGRKKSFTENHRQ